MSKTRRAQGTEWASRIVNLRHRFKLSQSELGTRLNASAMAVSRWERAVQEPPANIYIQLGNLTGDPECWYFWGRTGLRSSDLMRVLPAIRARLQKQRLPEMHIVQASAHQTSTVKGQQLIAIPLLDVTAATHGGKGDPVTSLEQARPESMMAAPTEWCPNPAYTNCLRVQGRSMMPLIHDGYIIVVDTLQTNRNKLYGEIVVVDHPNQGLIVSRLQRFDDTEVLVPENREYDSIPISGNGWRIVAKILWWIGKPA